MSGVSHTFEHEGLTIRVGHGPGTATVKWMGVSDSREPGATLGVFLEGLVAELKGKSVTVDFRQLEYMNSATVTPLMGFIKALDSNGIPATLHFDCSVDWQRINCQCMKAIARTLKTVRVEAH